MTSTRNLRPSQQLAVKLCDKIQIRTYCRILTIDIYDEQDNYKGQINKLLADGITIIYEMFEKRFQGMTRKWGNPKEIDFAKAIKKTQKYEGYSEICLLDTKTKKKWSIVLSSQQVDMKEWDRAEAALFQRDEYDFSTFNK